MTNVELSYLAVKLDGLDEAGRLRVLAILNKQRKDPVEPPPKPVKKPRVEQPLGSIDISKTWATASRMEKGLPPQGIVGLIR